MYLHERLIHKAAEIQGLTLTYSDSLGQYSTGTPYAQDDKPYNPLKYDHQAIDLAITCNLTVDFAHVKSRKRLRLSIVLRACSMFDAT